MERGATDEQICMFAGENLLRVWTDIERRAKEIQAEGTTPNEAVWEERIDGWTSGVGNDPFMFRSSREKAQKRKDKQITARGSHVTGNGIQKPQ